MPHFILDCSEKILELKEPKETIEAVFQVAVETGLFKKNDIKVRMNPFKYSLVQTGEADFIHVFGNIMQGRTDEQKLHLSRMMVLKLNELFPEVPIISMNIRDFEKASYYNKTMI